MSGFSFRWTRIDYEGGLTRIDYEGGLLIPTWLVVVLVSLAQLV